MDLAEWIDRKAPDIRVEKDVPMSRYTTFRAGGSASWYAEPENEEQLKTILSGVKECALPWMMIGNGSDLLFRDEGYHGAVIRFGSGFCYAKTEGDRMICGAGELMSKAARCAAENGLTGMEFMSGIPGTVGGGTFMNAGAYGGEIGGIIERAVCMTSDGEVIILEKEDMHFGYRRTVFMEKQLILLRVEFCLKHGDRETILETMNDLNARRREKQPLEYPSAGSFFKRPVGYFAGALIEQSGLKGKRVGDAQVSEKHAGFIINLGNATATEILELMKLVQDTIYARYAVQLEPEVRIIGGGT